MDLEAHAEYDQQQAARSRGDSFDLDNKSEGSEMEESKRKISIESPSIT